MKTQIILSASLIAISLLSTGCETTGVNARIAEKSALFASFTPEQQQTIREENVKRGYTSDMVYIAFGTPSKIDVKNTPEGKVEMWTYLNYYPSTTVSQINFGATYDQSSVNLPSHSSSGPSIVGTGKRVGTHGPKPTHTGAVNEPSLDLPDLVSHKLYIVLYDDKVIEMRMD